MRFEIGHTVAVIDDVLKGKVVGIEGEFIEIQDDEGMVYKFSQDELVIIKKDQHELSKYSDIENPLLKEKIKELELF